jgi:hypothetical protein
MSFKGPIETPVTGNDYAGDQRDSLQALSQFYRALNSRDLDLMQQNWDNSAETARDNPLGGTKRGGFGRHTNVFSKPRAHIGLNSTITPCTRAATCSTWLGVSAVNS